VFAGDVTELSVIIPTFEEADNLPATVEALRVGGISDIVVVDGGSADVTVEVAKRLNCRVFVAGEPGRAQQLNLGATESNGDLLLFLHADTIVGKDSLQALRDSMASEPDVVGGGFARQFASKSAFLRSTCRMAAWRSRKYGLFLGDQGIFARRSAFDRLGGFDESFGTGEDIDFSMRMNRAGRTIMIEPPVTSSARRFEKRGAIFQTVIDFFHARSLIRKSTGKMRT